MEYTSLTVVSLLVIFATVDLSCGQNDTVTDSSRGAVEEAMVPFYSMTNNFLEIVQPKSSNWTLLYWVADSLEEDPNSNSNSEFTADNWQDYIKKYVGMAVCIAIGIVFVVIMPIVGITLCCCRCCCGKCGAHAESKPDKNDRCSFYVCSVLLFVFSIFILAGTILTFITNEYLWEQTAFDNKGVMYDTEKTLKYMDTYKVKSKNDFVAISRGLKAKVDFFIADVKMMPESVRESFAEAIDGDNVLEAAKELQTSVWAIKSDLSTVDTSLKDLKSSGSTLVSQLNDLGSRMSNTLQSCPPSVSSQCDSLRSKVTSIQLLADFSKVNDVTSFLDDLRNVQLNDIYDTAVSEYRKIEEQLNQRIGNELKKIEDIGSKIKNDVDDAAGKVLNSIDDAVDFSGATDSVKETKPSVQNYGNYRKYVGIAIGCSLLISGVLFFLGLMFGCFGSDPDSESACNKATGANLLMGGIVWTFVVSWILMIIVIVLFATGGLAYTDGCRYFVHIGQTPESMRALEALTEITKSRGLDLNITSVVLKCKAKRGGYEAFNLSQFVDIDKEISVEKYNLKAELDRVKSLRLRIPAIDVINDQNYQQLTELGNANLQNIDFQSFYNEIQYDFTDENLNTIAAEADNLAAGIQAAGDTNRANTLRSQANEMRSIHQNTVTPMIRTKNQLEIAVRSLESLVKRSSGAQVFSDYVNNLKDAFDELQYRLDLKRADTGALTQYLQVEAQRIYDDIKDYLDTVKRRIREDVGNCGELYNEINYLLTTSLCERVVNPYNAFWFSVGWCLFFFIPSIIVAWDLNIQYRRIGYYGPDKGFEDHFRY